MPMIQPEYEYVTQQNLSKFRHEAHVARLERITPEVPPAAAQP